MITTLEQMEEKVLALKKAHRIAVAWAQDTNTIGALSKAVKKGFIEAILIGDIQAIRNTCRDEGIDDTIFRLVESENEIQASVSSKTGKNR